MRMSRWKKHLIALALALWIVSFPIFLVTGYTALYQAWVRGNLEAALPYLPWARNLGMAAMAAAISALAILFSSKTFRLRPKIRLSLSILATITIGFFAEFRNDGKFHFKNLVHFFGPGTWIHHGLNQIVPSLGDFLYRVEYSHWNDFLMGPAIVSVLFSVVFLRICGSSANEHPISLRASTPKPAPDLDDNLRFARIFMNIGLFWFFIQAWAEKAGYMANPHSSDELDLPFEFAGTMLGFWMARVLTQRFDERREKFRSTFFIDFLSSGGIGLLYTLIVGPLTESVSSSVAHALSQVVPHALDIHEYTPFQRHARPFELLSLAGAMWWGLNRAANDEQWTRLSTSEITGADSLWTVLITIARALAVTTAYLLTVVTMLSTLEPQGLGWAFSAAGAVGAGTIGLLLAKRAERGLTTVFSGNNDWR
jgi:hypothetical protein